MEGCFQFCRFPETFPGKGIVIMQLGNGTEPCQHGVKEKSQPDALALPMLAYLVHPVIPVPGTHQGQTMLPITPAITDGPHTMLVKIAGLLRSTRKIIIRFLFGVEQAPFQETDLFVQYAGITRMQHVTAGHIGQPEIVIGTTGTHTSPGRGMPPMLDISFSELAGGATQQVLAHKGRLRMKDGQGILQLIAETKSSPSLIIPAAAHDPAGNGLIQQPSVCQ